MNLKRKYPLIYETIFFEINNGTLFAFIRKRIAFMQFCVLLRKELKYLTILAVQATYESIL
jgi:hypothetical protein